MPEIFVNYRTGDEESAATMIDRELARRFGSDTVFRASRSIKPGQVFPEELLRAVHDSSVLLAVIGPRWLDTRTAQGGTCLDDPDDWTRREILAAFTTHTPVVPLLVGKANRLTPEALPPELAPLAQLQYRRLDHRHDEADLKDLADSLAATFPVLRAADRRTRRDAKADRGRTADGSSVHGAQINARRVDHRQYGGIGNLTGDLGTFVNEPRGPVHTGSGAQYNNSPQFSGEGMGVTFVSGDNTGDVRQQFGNSRPHEDEQR